METKVASREIKLVFVSQHPYIVKTGLSHMRHHLEGHPRSKLTEKEWLLGQWEFTVQPLGVRGVGGHVFWGWRWWGGVSNFCAPMMTMTGRILPVSSPQWS